MPFIQDILKYDSLSIVGLEKNTGKTECLNYVLRKLPVGKLRIAVSSIGIDGERIDQVTQTAKPEICLREGIYFATSEKHYKERRIISELVDISDERSSLGRIVTARALDNGKVLLSGPSSTASLKRWINGVQENFKIDLCIVDGALSRMSLASPTVSKSMILSTGAALSSNIKTLVYKSAFVVKLIELPITHYANKSALSIIDKGLFAIGKDNSVTELVTQSAFAFSGEDAAILKKSKAVYLSGALTDRFLNIIKQDSQLSHLEIIVKDFTKIFISAENFYSFKKSGGVLSVLAKSKLIAVCVNPLAPNGLLLNSDKLCEDLRNEINLPVYDIIKNIYEAQKPS